MKGYMTPNTRAMNHMHEHAPVSHRSRRTSTRAVVFLLSWWAGGAAYAVDFPAQPLQTGVVQPAPNIVFILDDSQSMVGAGGLALNTGLKWTVTSPALGDGDGAPYTKNPLSYNPATIYKPWAAANTSNTDVLRLDAADYAKVCDDNARITSCDLDLTTDHETYYVPKSLLTLSDQTTYYRYQIRKGGSKLVRSEWVNVDNAPTASAGTSRNETANASAWGSSGGTANQINGNYLSYTVPANAYRVVIATSGGSGNSRNPGIYVNVGSNPNRTGSTYQANANNNTNNETLTIDPATPGQTYRIGVFNHGTGTMTNVTLTVTYYLTSPETALGCTVHATNYGWKNCTDISASGDATYKVRALDDEKKNYANWYQYHRTRMKVAKAGGSEAFASLDKNYRVGLMGLYPSGTYQQVIHGSMGSIIPVDSNGGLFVGANRKDWFDHLHGMTSKNATPLRKALNGAGKYFSTDVAYRSKVGTDAATYLACRQNFAILTTDGYWNNYNKTDDPDSSYEGDAISGDEEAGEVFTLPNSKVTAGYKVEAPYTYSGLGDYLDKTTLADIATHYWKTDLLKTDVSGYKGSAENRVPYSDANPAFWQHMVTFGVGLGVRGVLSADQVVLAESGAGNSVNKAYWPAPVHTDGVEDNPANVDDLRHAALNSRGSYINANDAEEFSDGIANALNQISERKGSASNVLANSTSISTESFVYQATYTAGTWRGELLAYPISDAGLGDPVWWASKKVPAWGSRNIFTVAATGSGGSAFPNATQTTELGTAATSLGLGVTGTELAQYLKGDPAHEVDDGGTLRDRFILVSKKPKVKNPTLLGDIVDSSPFYVADIQTIFVGANDGMLHAFDAGSTESAGTERFTYIPRGVAMDQLAKLAEPLYGNAATKPHLFFVDGPIVVSAKARTPGKNYLIGALGRGGKGVYGLNVTSAASFSDKDVLWDNTGSTATEFANMGNVISEPLISKMNNDVTAAVVANGPNSSTGTASLFVINLDTGAVIKELDTGATGSNGLSAPRAVDANTDGKVDFYFAGDLLGNLWRFDVRAASAGAWTSNKVFSAKDATDVAQPITSAPGVGRDPATGDIWVFFGTGRYMTTDDQTSTSTQSYYGIIVGSTGLDGDNLTRAKLQKRSIKVVEAATGRRAFEPAATGVGTGTSGWYIDLNNPSGTGERVISAPLLFNDILIFSSIVPPSKTNLNSCDAGGTGYINALDAFSGTSLDTPFFADLAIPTVKDGDKDLPIGSLPIGKGMPTAPIIIGNQLVVGDSSGTEPTSMEVNAPGGASTRRVSWRELLNDQ
jgi:type IV pilus assembly protein PilY1